MIVWALVLLPALLVGPSQANKKCRYRKFSSDHTMCRSTPSWCNITKTGMDEGIKKHILHLHNKLRSKIATGNQSGFPKAANMMELTWDDELSLVAQKHTELCVFEHDCHPCRETPRIKVVGQNIHQLKDFLDDPYPEKEMWTYALIRWYNELNDFPTENIKPLFHPKGKMTGHFTQMMLAETKVVGCGYSEFNNIDEDSVILPVEKIGTCDYGPGQIVGPKKTLYKQGEPCSACPSLICSAKYPGLCAH